LETSIVRLHDIHTGYVYHQPDIINCTDPCGRAQTTDCKQCWNAWLDCHLSWGRAIQLNINDEAYELALQLARLTGKAWHQPSLQLCANVSPEKTGADALTMSRRRYAALPDTRPNADGIFGYAHLRPT
jgi:hypothetical protein